MFRVTEAAQQPREKISAPEAAGLAAFALAGSPEVPETPSPKVAERFVETILAALAVFLSAFARRERAFLLEALDARGVKIDDVAEAVEEELSRNREFAARSKQRMREALGKAMADPDATNRKTIVRSAMAAERRYAVARTHSAAARASAAADRVVLRQVSPTGAYWELDPLVREHTPGCLFLGGRVWPWEVINRVHPPRHGGCPCRLRSVGEALSEGLIRAGDLPDPEEAVRAAAGVMMEADEQEWKDALVRTGLADAERVEEAFAAQLTRVPRKLREDENSRGVMVAFYPSRVTADALAIRGGEKPEEIHLTLAYLGTVDEIGSPQRLAQAVQSFAGSASPIEGEIAGTGIFTAGPEPVTYASFDAPGLPTFREILVSALNDAGFPPRSDHGFTPHMTLAYEARPLATVENLRVRFETVSLVVGGERTDFVLTGEPLEELFREWMVKRSHVPGHQGQFADKPGGGPERARLGSTRLGKPASAPDPRESKPKRSGRKEDPSKTRGEREREHARREAPSQRMKGRVHSEPKGDEEKQRDAQGNIIDFDATATRGKPTRDYFGEHYDSEDYYGVRVETESGEKIYVYEQPDRTHIFERGEARKWGFGKGYPRSARHDAIEKRMRRKSEKAGGGERKPPTDRKPIAVFLSGGPASGKGSMEEGKGGIILEDGSHFDPQGAEAVAVNPDDVAVQLPENQAISDRDGNGRSAVHEQASSVAKRITKNALDDGYDLFVDIVGGGNPGKFEKKLDEAIEAGHEVQHIHVLTPVDQAKVQAKGRYEHAKEKLEVALKEGAPQSKIDGIRRSLRLVEDRVLETGHREASQSTVRLLGIEPEGELKFEERDGKQVIVGAKPKEGVTTRVYAPPKFKEGSEPSGAEGKKLVAYTTPEGDVVVVSPGLLELLRSKAVS